MAYCWPFGAAGMRSRYPLATSSSRVLGAWRCSAAYFRTNCFLSIEADELPARYYVEEFGDENLVFSTDYPHGDSKYPDAVSGFLDLPGVSDESKRKILWDNWARLYGV